MKKNRQPKRLYRHDSAFGLIDIATGLPKEQVSCPGCSLRYGHHKTRTCAKCEECEKCCNCQSGEANLMTYADWKPVMLTRV